jgi:hypothetical protein
METHTDPLHCNITSDVKKKKGGGNTVQVDSLRSSSLNKASPEVAPHALAEKRILFGFGLEVC